MLQRSNCGRGPALENFISLAIIVIRLFGVFVLFDTSDEITLNICSSSIVWGRIGGHGRELPLYLLIPLMLIFLLSSLCRCNWLISYRSLWEIWIWFSSLKVLHFIMFYVLIHRQTNLLCASTILVKRECSFLVNEA